MSRNLSVSRECDMMMWRVNLFCVGNEAAQCMQGYMRLLPVLLLLPPPPPVPPGLSAGDGEGDRELAGEEPRPSARPPPPPVPLPAPPDPPALPATKPPPPLEPAPPTTDEASAAATVASCNQTRTKTVNFLFNPIYMCLSSHVARGPESESFRDHN